MASMGATAREVTADIANRPTVDNTGIDALVRGFLQQKQTVSGMEAVDSIDSPTAQSAPRRDFDMTTELLDRASQAFDLLINRCQTLEHDLEDANERSQAHAAQQNEVITQLKQIASKLKEQLEVSEQAMMSLRTRCNAVEARAVRAEEKAKALEAASIQAAEHAALAESLSTRLHDKVVSAFGIGSRAHPVLEAVATRTVAE